MSSLQELMKELFPLTHRITCGSPLCLIKERADSALERMRFKIQCCLRLPSNVTLGSGIHAPLVAQKKKKPASAMLSACDQRNHASSKQSTWTLTWSCPSCRLLTQVIKVTKPNVFSRSRRISKQLF